MALKVSHKIFALSGITVGAVALITIATGGAISSIKSNTTALVDVEIPQLNTLREIQLGILNARRFEKDILMQIGATEKQKEYQEKLKKTEEMLTQKGKEAAEFATAANDIPSTLKAEAKALPENLATYFSESHKVLNAAVGNAQASIPKSNEDLKVAKDAMQKANETLEKLVETSVSNRAQVSSQLTAAVSRALAILVTIGLAAIMASLFGAYTLVKSIVNPLHFLAKGTQRLAMGDIDMQGTSTTQLQETVQKEDELGDIGRALESLITYQKDKVHIASEVARGNLVVDPKTVSDQDALGRALVQMHGNLNSLILQLRTTADQVSQGSAQVSVASQALAKGATSQAATLEQISAAVTEMTSQAKQNANNAVQASESAALAQTAAEDGKLKIETTVSAMNDISAASQQISKVIKLIDDIAFQTNLLALNAAVEAARAGKHGKGFAVVADEVRNLASRSAKAAKETSELIESSLGKVENGVKQAQSTADSFVSINDGVTQMSVALSAIVDSSNAQAGSAHEIAQGLNNVNNVTQQNTASAEENAAASQQMNGMAAQLKNIVSRFQVKDDMTTNAARSMHAPASQSTAAPSAAKTPTPAPKAQPVAPKPAATHTPKAPQVAAPKPTQAAASTPQHSSATPAAKPLTNHPTYSSKGDTNASKGWGGTDKSHIPAVKPEEVLALDDEEFGKY